MFNGTRSDCIKTLLLTPVLVFRDGYALGQQPKAWREVEVVFIPEAGNKDPEQPKSCRLFLLTN
jgi:hypothetical protein